MQQIPQTGQNKNQNIVQRNTSPGGCETGAGGARRVGELVALPSRRRDGAVVLWQRRHTIQQIGYAPMLA
eukprot:3336534-Pyramimonas_sp.AAC.1